MAYYKSNVFIHATVLILVNIYHFAQSELKGFNVCLRSKQINETTQVITQKDKKNSIHISAFDCNITVECWYERVNTNITVVRQVNKTINECCRGYIESSDHTSCIHEYGIQNNLGAFVGILILIVISVLFLYYYFCTNDNTADALHREHALPLDQKSNYNENNLDSSLFLKNASSLNNLNGTSLTHENRTADRYQAFLHKLKTVDDKIAASRLMESGMSQSMINDNDDNKSSATYESIEV